MTDPLSIIAGVAGIACAAVQLSKSLHDISNRLINAPQEIDDIASELDSLGSIFKLICKTLKSNRDVVKDELINNVVEAQTRFQALQKDVQYLIANAKDFKGLRWLFRRERVSALMAKIAALKSNLQLVLSIIDIAVTANTPKAKPRKKKSSQQNALERFDRVIAENYAEAIRQSIRRLRVEQIKSEQFEKTGGELLQLHYWKEPLGQTAAWLFYRTLSSAIENPTNSVRDRRVGYAKTVTTHQEDDIATDSEFGDDIGRQRRFPANSTELGATMTADEEDELHVTRNLGHKVVTHLLRAWTTLSKHQIVENGKAASQVEKSDGYGKAVENMIRGCLKADQVLGKLPEPQAVQGIVAIDERIKLADLGGRVIQSSGEVHDDQSVVIGRLTEGSAIKLSKKGAICDRYGNVLHRSKIVGKVVTIIDPNATAGVDQQAEYPPVPDAPKPPPYSEKPEPPAETVEAATNAADENSGPQTVTRKSTDDVNSSTSLAALEGLCCDRNGLIKDTQGSIIGKITEGDSKEFSSKKYFCDSRGNVLDYQSQSVGKCAIISKADQETPVDKDDSTPTRGGSQEKISSAQVPTSEEGTAVAAEDDWGGWGAWTKSKKKGTSAMTTINATADDEGGDWDDWTSFTTGKKKEQKRKGRADKKPPGDSFYEVRLDDELNLGTPKIGSSSDKVADITTEETANVAFSLGGWVSGGGFGGIDVKPAPATTDKTIEEKETTTDHTTAASDQEQSTTPAPHSHQTESLPPQLPLLEEVQDVERETADNTVAASSDRTSSRKPIESVTEVEELGGTDSDATAKRKAVKFERADGNEDWRKHPPMIVPYRPSPPAKRSRSASRARQEEVAHLVAKLEESIDQPKAPANSPAFVKPSSQTSMPSVSKLSARTPTQSAVGSSQQQNSGSTSSNRNRGNGRTVGSSIDRNTGWDAFPSSNQYQMMPYHPHGAYPGPYDSYAYPPVLYDPQLALSQRKAAEKNDRISQLESQVRAQEHLMRLQELTRAKEREEDALQRKRDEEREIEEKKRDEGMEEIAKMMKEQNEKAVMMEKEVLARARAAEEATQHANRKMEKLQLKSQEVAAENARALKAAREEAAMFAEREAKALAEIDEQKRLISSNREEAEKAKLAIVAEYTERIRKESEAKVTAETAHRFAEEKCRELQKAQLQRPPVPPEVPSAPQFAYPMPTIAECYGEASDDEGAEASETDATKTEDAASEFWPASSNQSLRRVRVQQEDLEDDPSHKIIFPMRSGWKEHEMKTITKSMARFGYTPLYEEVEVPCMPNQFYEIPGSGGCNLRGTALWQPPGPTLASELHTSYLKSGWKHTYVRANEYGETWFLGRQPIHSVMFTINYIPQASADDEYSRINHHHSEGGRLYISKEWVEKETLDELGYKNMFLSDWRVSLDPSLTHADIETAVARSFFLRETRLRKKYRNFTPLPSSTVKKIEDLGSASDTGSTKSFAPSTSSVNKPSRFRSLISRSGSRSGGFSSPRN